MSLWRNWRLSHSVAARRRCRPGNARGGNALSQWRGGAAERLLSLECDGAENRNPAATVLTAESASAAARGPWRWVDTQPVWWTWKSPRPVKTLLLLLFLLSGSRWMLFYFFLLFFTPVKEQLSFLQTTPVRAELLFSQCRTSGYKTQLVCSCSSYFTSSFHFFFLHFHFFHDSHSHHQLNTNNSVSNIGVHTHTHTCINTQKRAQTGF